MAYPEHLLVPGERVLVHRRPHWRMLVVPAVVPPLAAGVAAWLAALGSRASWHGALWIALALLAVGAVGWFSVGPVLRWRTTHFVVTDRRLLVREGVVSRAGIAVAVKSITSVRTRSGGLDRLLGAGTLVVAVDHAREPWEFDGLGDLARTAALVEHAAESVGGLGPGPPPDGADDADEYDDEGFDDVDEFDLPLYRRSGARR